MKNLFARAIIIVALIGMNIPSFAGDTCLRGGTLQNCREEFISTTTCYCFFILTGTDCYGYENEEGTKFIYCTLEVE